MSKLTCPYCSVPAEKCHGDRVYPHRVDLYHKIFWICPQCESFVGCHIAMFNESQCGQVMDLVAAYKNSKVDFS